MQSVYDKVLQDGRGKTVDDVKTLLAQEWRSTFRSDLDLEKAVIGELRH